MLTALCVSALSLSLAAKAGEWRDVRLPELTQEMLDQRKAMLRQEEEAQARKAWAALADTDAALQWLCVTTRLRQADVRPATVASVEVTATGTGLITRDAAAVARLQAVGGEASPTGDGATRIAITPETCR